MLRNLSTMVDNRLTVTKSWKQTLTLHDGSTEVVQNYQIHTRLTDREVLPIFEYPVEGGSKPRRVLLPYFQYDWNTKMIVGEEGETTTLDDRMVLVIEAAKSHGFDQYLPDQIMGVCKSVHFHLFFSNVELHAMGCIPHFSEMKWWFMVRSDLELAQ